MNDSLVEFFKKLLNDELFDSVLVPVKVPAGDSYAWVLLENAELLDDVNVLPPVMTVQGGRALSSITKHGAAARKIAAVMRPCEVRAAIELAKLGQIELENITLISYDCPGAMPLGDYLAAPEKGEKKFAEAVKKGDLELMRKICKVCVNFGLTAPDIHLATTDGAGLMIPATEKGEELLKTAGLKADQDVSGWAKAIEKRKGDAEGARKKLFETLAVERTGMENLPATFDKCLACHNCMRVCPICYCRRCYFEGDSIEKSPRQRLKHAAQKGSVRFSPDILLFQLGRMSHMSFSCVSCGMCEDACPVDIPVAQMFSLVADETQKMFDYVPGMNPDEAQPLRKFTKEKELDEIERLTKDPLE